METVRDQTSAQLQSVFVPEFHRLRAFQLGFLSLENYRSTAGSQATHVSNFRHSATSCVSRARARVSSCPALAQAGVIMITKKATIKSWCWNESQHSCHQDCRFLPVEASLHDTTQKFHLPGFFAEPLSASEKNQVGFGHDILTRTPQRNTSNSTKGQDSPSPDQTCAAYNDKSPTNSIQRQWLQRRSQKGVIPN